VSHHEDHVHLTYILECIANLKELTSEGRAPFEARKHARAAALYYLQTLAESTQRLSESSKAAHPEIDWVGIKGFRHRLVHGYLNINVDILWNVIEQSLPELEHAIHEMLNTLDDQNEN